MFLSMAVENEEDDNEAGQKKNAKMNLYRNLTYVKEEMKEGRKKEWAGER